MIALFTICLAIDVTDENGCTGLLIASANGKVSKIIFIRITERILLKYSESS